MKCTPSHKASWREITIQFVMLGVCKWMICPTEREITLDCLCVYDFDKSTLEFPLFCSIIFAVCNSVRAFDGDILILCLQVNTAQNTTVCVCVRVNCLFFWIRLLQLGWGRVSPTHRAHSRHVRRMLLLATHPGTEGQVTLRVCPAALEVSRQMCDTAASCRQIPGANAHPLLQALSLYFQGKKKEADWDRRQAARARGADTSAAALQGKQLIHEPLPWLDLQLTRQRAGQSLPWREAARFHSARKPSLGFPCECLTFRALFQHSSFCQHDEIIVCVWPGLAGGACECGGYL